MMGILHYPLQQDLTAYRGRQHMATGSDDK